MTTDVPHPAFEAYASETLPQAAPETPGKQGELTLHFAPDRKGQTRLIRDYARVPYHVSGTLSHDPHPDATTVYLQSPTGGIAQGDRLHAEIQAAPGSVAVVSTQSATKIQSMDRNYASESMSLSVEQGGHLEYVPEPTILHAGARFSQELTLRVTSGATAVIGEIILPGRLARDEEFDFDRYYSRLQVEGDQGLLFEDTTHLRPAEADPTAPGIFGEFPVYGTLYVVAPQTDETTLANQIHKRIGTETAHAGATALPNGAGVLVRVLADRAEQADGTLHDAWNIARQELLDVVAPKTRRY